MLVDTPTRNRAGCIDGLRIIGPNADTLLTDYRAWPENNFPRPHSSPPLFFSPSLSFLPSLFLFPSFLRRGPPGFFPSLLFSFFTLPVHQGFHLLTRALSPRGVEKDTGLDHVLLFPPFISFSFFLALFLSGPGICFSPPPRFSKYRTRGPALVKARVASPVGFSILERNIGDLRWPMLFSMPDFEIERDSNWCENHRVKCEREKETAFCVFRFYFLFFVALDVLVEL